MVTTTSAHWASVWSRRWGTSPLRRSEGLAVGTIRLLWPDIERVADVVVPQEVA
jgi:hypothetical protein